MSDSVPGTLLIRGVAPNLCHDELVCYYHLMIGVCMIFAFPDIVIFVFLRDSGQNNIDNLAGLKVSRHGASGSAARQPDARWLFTLFRRFYQYLFPPALFGSAVPVQQTAPQNDTHNLLPVFLQHDGGSSFAQRTLTSQKKCIVRLLLPTLV